MLIVWCLLAATCWWPSAAQIYNFRSGQFVGDGLFEPTTNFSEVCLGVLGCFHNGPPFHDPVHRPVSLLPEPVHVRLFLYTRDNPAEAVLIKNGSELLNLDHFNVSKETKIIVHGFLDTLSISAWMKNLQREMLRYGDRNVILTDWSDGNQFPYVQAVANTRVVGAELANFVNTMKAQHDLDPALVHILGLSLGSQIAGYAGKGIRGLGRITGMDPPGPYFQHIAPEARLAPTDANFVEVLHTNAVDNFAQGLGNPDLMGHVDYFPNGGREQPSCQERSFLYSLMSGGFVRGMRDLLACHHLFAADLMSGATGPSSCIPPATVCEDWESYTAGLCLDGPTVRLGQDVPDTSLTIGRRAFFYTGMDFPFCTNQYLVTLTLSGDSNHTLGVKLLELILPSNVQIPVIAKRQLRLGTANAAIIGVPQDLLQTPSLRLRWFSNGAYGFTRGVPMPLESISIVPFPDSQLPPKVLCSSGPVLQYSRINLRPCDEDIESQE